MGIAINFSKYIDKIIYLVTFIIVILSILRIDLLPADDAFFYLKVAENYTNGFGFTFNKIYQTNGFHPLWMYICVVINYVTKFLDLQKFTIYFLATFQICIFYLSISKLNKLLSTKNQINNLQSSPIIFLTLFLIYIATGTLLLMESIIVLFLIIYILCEFYNIINKLKTNETTYQNIFKIAILVALLFLARLDSIFFIFYFSILLLFIFIKYKKSENNSISSPLLIPTLIKSTLIYILTILFFASIYLIYNKINFGSFGTISSEIKNKFPVFIFDDINIWGRIILFSNFIYAIILSLFKTITFKKVKYLLILTSITHILFAFCFQLNTAQWYWNFGYLSLSFLVYDIVLIIKEKINLKYFEDFTKVVLLLGVVSIFYTKNNLLDDFNKTHKIKELVKAIESNTTNKTNKNIIIYTYDFPGRLAYYSNFQVIPFDGLISNKDYIKALEENSIEDFIKLKKINYLITPQINYSDPKDIKRLNYQVQKVNNNPFNIKLTIFNPITLNNGKSIYLENNKLLFKAQNPLLKWQKEYTEIGIWDFNK